MNEFVPRGYLTLEKAVEYFGQLKHAGEWEAEKASSKQEFQQLLFEGNLSAKLFTDYGDLISLPSRDWGGIGAERIFETGRASISVGNEYFPDTVHGLVLIEQSAIGALTAEASPSTTEAETKCRKWLTVLMTGNSKPEKVKAAYKKEAQAKWPVGSKAFGRAWTDAIKDTGNTTWSDPGRKS